MSEKFFISSEDCFVGETKNGQVKVGFSLDLYSDPNIISDSIEFDKLLWTEEKGKLTKVLNVAIACYQKKYRVMVSNIAIIGDVFQKGKHFIFGKLINATENPLDYIEDFSYINVHLDEDEIEIKFKSIDGSDGNLKLYLMTTSKTKRLVGNKKSKDYTFNDFLSIRRGSKPVIK